MNEQTLALTVIANALDDIAPRFDDRQHFKSNREKTKALQRYRKALANRRRDFQRRQNKYADGLKELVGWRDRRLAVVTEGRHRETAAAKVEDKYRQEVWRVARNVELFDIVGNAIHWFQSDRREVERWCLLGGLDVESVYEEYRTRLRLLGAAEEELLEGQIAPLPIAQKVIADYRAGDLRPAPVS